MLSVCVCHDVHEYSIWSMRTHFVCLYSSCESRASSSSSASAAAAPVLLVMMVTSFAAHSSALRLTRVGNIVDLVHGNSRSCCSCCRLRHQIYKDRGRHTSYCCFQQLEVVATSMLKFKLTGSRMHCFASQQYCILHKTASPDVAGHHCAEDRCFRRALYAF